MYYFIFVMCFATTMNGIMCDNTTYSYPSANFNTRTNRLLSFHSDENEDIKVELDFNVPFLSIPIKPTLDLANGALANINIGAVVLAGILSFGAAIAIPGTYHLLNKQFSLTGSNLFGNKYRSDTETSGLWSIMASVDQALANNNIDSTSCVQRAICWTVKNSNSNMSAGQGASTDKIIDGLATNEWIKYLVEGSVFQAAIDSGLRGTNCAAEYAQCKINQNTIQMFSKKFINAIYNRK